VSEPVPISAAEDAIRRRRGRRPRRSQARFDPRTGRPTLLGALEAMDTRKGLTGELAVVGAYRLGAHDDAPYGLTFANGQEVVLGDADRVLNLPRKVKATIAGAVGVSLTLPKTDEWDCFFEALHKEAEIRDATLSRKEATCDWLASFIAVSKHRSFDLSDPDQTAQAIAGADEPFRAGNEGNRLYVRLAKVVQHATLDVGQRTTQPDASQRLGELGFRRKQLSARVIEERDGEKVEVIAKARLWASPPGFDPDDDPAVPTSPPLVLRDQTDQSEGTRGRGDEPTGTDDPREEQRGHVGTLSHEDDPSLSVKGDSEADPGA
jgi:hypothetical protein